jgi:cytochrome c553
VRKITCVALLVVSAITAGNVLAADAAAGKGKAAICSACHGANGVSPSDPWPNLASQKAGYLVKQLKAFRDGTRKDPLMSPMAQPLSDADIDDLAAYFSTTSATPSSR